MSGKTLADDIYSVDGTTTVPVEKEGGGNEGDEDSFNLSIETNETKEEMEMDLPEEQNTGKKTENENETEPVVDLINIEKLNDIHANTQQAGENMNFGLDDEEEVKERKSNQHNNDMIGGVESVHIGSTEADSTGGSKSVNSDFDNKYNEDQDRRWKNTVQEPKKSGLIVE